MSRAKLKRELAEVRSKIDTAYWAFTRTARGRLAPPDLYARRAALERLLSARSMGTSLKKLGEQKILEALERARGRVSAAAAELDVPRESLRTALATWAKHLGETAAALRGEAGYDRGRPGVMEHQIDRKRFLDAWERHEQRILPVAVELEVDRFVVRRLARLYDAPGAPPARVSRKSLAE